MHWSNIFHSATRHRTECILGRLGNAGGLTKFLKALKEGEQGDTSSNFRRSGKQSISPHQISIRLTKAAVASVIKKTLAYSTTREATTSKAPFIGSVHLSQPNKSAKQTSGKTWQIFQQKKIKKSNLIELAKQIRLFFLELIVGSTTSEPDEN